MLLSPPCFFHLPSTDMDPLSRAPEDVQARIAALLPTRDRQALDEGCPAVVGFPTLPCRLTAHSSLPACRVRLGGANTLLRRASLDWFPEVVLVEEPWGSRHWEHKQEAEHLAVSHILTNILKPLRPQHSMIAASAGPGPGGWPGTVSRF